MVCSGRPNQGRASDEMHLFAARFSENETPFPRDIADWLYLLYGLTVQEIAIVEGATAR